ncbi:glycosyltransferase family 25 protein [Pedobacter metabolipauper]|uniref:Glycosyl transferase family 25 n=1 Tax=Pedobacter metabolipauper TaxID=425513 RepID=A0A4R6SWD8_9SPHI|nr:hypothetical protein [Pedobacter metabolipauper]TDQ08442.1 hypothetical protein ATK78_2956 [Pedobacter metabolipauper]
MKNHAQFPIYVINLKKRPERLQSIQHEFLGRNEFKVTIVEAIEHPNGAIGLWQSIRSVFSKVTDEEFIIICEDDHQFTDAYSPEILASCIDEARKNDADVLLGGVSWFTEAAQIAEYLFSVETFSATQFVVVFSKFYKQILDADFGDHDSADYKIAALSTKKFILFPFISTQKEFGYSDATSKNDNFGRVTAIFNSAIQRLSLLNQIWKFYDTNPVTELPVSDYQATPHQVISTYILASDPDALQMDKIREQFKDKHEFDTTIVRIAKRETDNQGFLYFIQEVIKLAIAHDEDKIVICNSNHQFTSTYTSDYFFECIQLAQNANAKIISGGTDRFGSAVAVQTNLYWVDWFTNAQFVVLFKSCFDAILRLPKTHHLSLSMIYNNASSNKLLIYPFISRRLDSESEPGNQEAMAENYKRMNFMRNEYIKYSLPSSRHLSYYGETY